MPDAPSSFAVSAPADTPAATLVVFRHGPAGGGPELLFVERSPAMRFAGGMTVFPGGLIDPADYELAARLGLDVAGDGAARIAAVRETLEETGLVLGVDQPVSAGEAAAAREMLMQEAALAPVLAAFGWRLALDRLVPFARWCPVHIRAFDTRFYLADCGTGAVELTVDATENTRLFWASAARALAMADAGDISIIFPTRRNLERLALFGNYADARRQAEAITPRKIVPAIHERDGRRWLSIPDGLGYPVLEENLDSVRRG